MDFSTTTLWAGLFPIAGVWEVLLSLSFVKIPVVNANSTDPDQMSLSATSYQGLHCLLITILGVSRLTWVKG